jgi:hypothetical protein
MGRKFHTASVENLTTKLMMFDQKERTQLQTLGQEG